MYIQGVDNVYDLNFNGREGDREGHLWRHLPAGRAGIFAAQFRIRRYRHAVRAVPHGRGGLHKYLADGKGIDGHKMALPAYDQCIKASHAFNLLDARGVIAVTERQSYILRVRELAKACGAAWLETAGGGAAGAGAMAPAAEACTSTMARKPKKPAPRKAPARSAPARRAPAAAPVDHRLVVASVGLAVPTPRGGSSIRTVRRGDCQRSLPDGGTRIVRLVRLGRKRGGKGSDSAAYDPASLDRNLVLTLFVDDDDFALFRDVFVRNPGGYDPGIRLWARTARRSSPQRRQASR